MLNIGEMSTDTPLLQRLKRAIEISEQIQQLEQELRAVLGGAAPVEPNVAPSTAFRTTKTLRGPRAKRIVSPEAREKMAAAQRRRWAKSKKK